jgi:hypothetical protein
MCKALQAHTHQRSEAVVSGVIHKQFGPILTDFISNPGIPGAVILGRALKGRKAARVAL